MTAVFPPKPNALEALFRRSRGVVIGVVHLNPLPGAPRYAGGGLGPILSAALADAEAYQAGGMDGIVVENHGDIPFVKPQEVGHETVAAMSVVAQQVRCNTALPLGINVLANAAGASLAVALAAGAQFIRVNQWVNAYVANEGFIEGRAAQVTRYRSSLRAEHIRVFADVHVKHGAHALVADRSLGEQARDAEFFDADVLIATGNRTGDTTALEEIAGIRTGSSLPLIVGSGVSLDNAEEIFAAADGAIVASSLKAGGVWWNPVELTRVKRLVERVRSLE